MSNAPEVAEPEEGEAPEPEAVVSIGEFWVPRLGLLKAALPEDSGAPYRADLASERVTFTLTHPELYPRIAVVIGLDPVNAEWTIVPSSWPKDLRAIAIDRAAGLRRRAMLQQGRTQ
ncbi:hypothetical protein AB0B28_06520 [Glycomyces sp. NPDC046736]|uniref:hypothetical protein n=1 Tax=Glycomyces sp. NPDC046736 TaxID=3155615 RepID=UPI0033D3DBD8